MLGSAKYLSEPHLTLCLLAFGVVDLATEADNEFNLSIENDFLVPRL